MKKIISILLLTSSFAYAQTKDPVQDQTSKAPESLTEPANGAIVPATTTQKKSVQKKNSKKETPKVLDDSEVTPLPDEPYDYSEHDSSKPVEVRKEALRDNTIVKNKPYKVDKNLFGFHADVNIPHILNYGLDYWHSSRLFSVALNTGGYSINGVAKSSDIPDGANIKIANQEAVLRYHPFAGSFYLGLGFGNHQITADANRHITVTTPIAGSADVAINDKVKANYFLPHVGWLWKTSFGLMFGMDLGFLSPVSPSVDVSTQFSNISNPAITSADLEATDDYKKAKQEVIDQSEKYGKMGLPYWTVIRVGWLF